jgi:hypothetical protein
VPEYSLDGFWNVTSLAYEEEAAPTLNLAQFGITVAFREPNRIYVKVASFKPMAACPGHLQRQHTQRR